LKVQGFALWWLVFYVLYPLVFIPGLSLMTTAFLYEALGYSREERLNMVFWIIFVSLYVALSWAVFVLPLSDRLVLYERGIRIKSGFKRRIFSFDAVESILIGRAPSKMEKGLRGVLAILKPGDARWMRSLDSSGITVVTKDGKAHVFKLLLTRFKPREVEEFFRELVRQHPRFGVSSPAAEPA
jgi:hypothetical protein